MVSLGLGRGVVLFQDLVVLVVIPNGPVLLKNSGFLEAEDVSQVQAPGHWLVIVLWGCGLYGKLLVQAVEEAVQQWLVGRGDLFDAFECQLFHKWT